MLKIDIKCRWFVKLVLSVALISLYLLLTPALSPAELPCFTDHWPYERSDLRPDPQLVRGKLANGLRYIIKKNHKPENRVAVYLDVRAGSFQESDDQRGLAHFLEHMMFNGSDHFPPGTLVDYFQSIGMGFGNDVNAHTSYDETVYRLILPDGSKEDLQKGLQVMADYARGALLLESEIDRERGVILAEKRARDSASYRARIATTSFAFRGTRLPERRVIGLEEVLKKADRQLLKSYYDAWYRPENMVLAIVGDIIPSEAEVLLNSALSDLRGSGPRADCPEFGSLTHKGTEPFYHYEPEIGKTEIGIETLWDILPENDSVALKKRELTRYIGTKIMRYRLQKLSEKPDVPFTQARYYYGDIADHIGYGSFSAQTDADNWQKSLTSINNALKQVIVFGFSEKEMTRAKKEIIATFDASVLKEKSEDSTHIARKIIRHINSNRVYQSAEQEQELYTPLVEKVTLNEINREFRKIWGHDSRLISVTGDVQLGENADRNILSAFQSSVQQPVSAYNENSIKSFPYLSLPENVSSYREQDLSAEFDIERLVFDNGLILNLKNTDFSKNSLLLSVNFGQGKLQEPLPGMAMLADSVINKSGTGALTKSAFDAALAGSSVDLHFRIGESSYLWAGSSLKKDFDLLLQALYTLLLDPGFREDVFDSVMTNTEQMYNMLGRDIGGAMPLKVQSFLASGNPHFGLPSWNNVASIDYKHLSGWVKKIIPSDGLEISVVGDFKREQVVEGIKKYFSGLELRKDQHIEPTTVVFPEGHEIEIEVQTSIEKSLVFVSWPTEDFRNITRTRRFHILAAVFEDRLRKVIREKLGATYSPVVYSSNSKTYKGYGFLAAKMVVKPGEEEKILKEILYLAEELRLEGITEEELERAREPMVTSIGDSLMSNNYWLYSVISLSSRYPEQLKWPQTILNDYSTISKEEINLLAKKYLNNTKSATALVRPERE